MNRKDKEQFIRALGAAMSITGDSQLTRNTPLNKNLGVTMREGQKRETSDPHKPVSTLLAGFSLASARDKDAINEH